MIQDLIATGQLTEYGNVIGTCEEQVERYLESDEWKKFAETVEWAIPPHPGHNEEFGVWFFYGVGRSRAAR